MSNKAKTLKTLTLASGVVSAAIKRSSLAMSAASKKMPKTLSWSTMNDAGTIKEDLEIRIASSNVVDSLDQLCFISSIELSIEVSIIGGEGNLGVALATRSR